MHSSKNRPTVHPFATLVTLSPDDFVVLALLCATVLLLLKMLDLAPTPSCPTWSPLLKSVGVTLTFEELKKLSTLPHSTFSG